MSEPKIAIVQNQIPWWDDGRCNMSLRSLEVLWIAVCRVHELTYYISEVKYVMCIILCCSVVCDCYLIF